MSEASLTNGELAIMLKGMKESSGKEHGNIEEKLVSIEKHVLKINGRVKSLEIWKAGIVAVLVVVNMLVIPIAISWIKLKIL